MTLALKRKKAAVISTEQKYSADSSGMCRYYTLTLPVSTPVWCVGSLRTFILRIRMEVKIVICLLEWVNFYISITSSTKIYQIIYITGHSCTKNMFCVAGTLQTYMQWIQRTPWLKIINIILYEDWTHNAQCSNKQRGVCFNHYDIELCYICI